MDYILKTKNGITVTVDYRTELLGIIMYLSEYDKKCPIRYIEEAPNKSYIEKIINDFSSYKDDSIIKQFKSLYEYPHDFSYDAPINMFLQLDENFDCEKLNDYIFEERLKSDESVYSFIKGLKSFADKIDFASYYNNYKSNYELYINSVLSCFDSIDINSYLNSYFGSKIEKDYIINLLPFATLGGYNATFDKKIYSSIAVDPNNSTKDNLFDIKYKDAFVVTNIHEFCHGYVDPITDKLSLVTDNTTLFDDIRDNMKQQAYPSDKEIINEHINRAIELRTIKNIYHNDEWYDYRIKHEKENGFIYIDVVEESLQEYEQNRDIYSTFDMFYPIIIERIKSYKNKKDM